MKTKGALALEKALIPAPTTATVPSLAAELGVSRQTIYEWLQGNFRPDDAKRLLLKERLGIEPGWWSEPTETHPDAD